jgi:hypothetical protein
MYAICAGMLRSCSTWQYMVVSHFVEHFKHGVRLGFVDAEQYITIKAREREYKKLAGSSSDRWHVVKVHEEDQEFGLDLESGRALAVYSFRDLRDVTFSLMRLRKISFDELVFEHRTLETIMKSHAFWMSQPNTLTQQYEQIVRKPVETIQQLATHLGISLPSRVCSSLAGEYSLDANRRRTEALAARLKAEGVDLSDPVNFEAHDNESRLHWNHISDGRVGIWRGLATEEHYAVFERILGQWLVEHGYERKKSWQDWLSN